VSAGLVARRDHPGITGPLDMATMRSLPHIVLVSELRNMLSPAAGLLAQGVRRREVYASNKLWAVFIITERTDLSEYCCAGFIARSRGISMSSRMSCR